MLKFPPILTGTSYTRRTSLTTNETPLAIQRWNNIKVLCLFFAISAFASLLGCGHEGNEQEPPRVTYVNIGEGDIVPSYMVITARFSKEMEWVEIDVSEVTGITYLLTRNRAEWRVKWPRMLSPYDILSQTAYPWYGPIPEGSHTLMITGRDKAGEELEGFEPINFTVIPPGHSPPGIYGSECDPRDGATNVDPQQYKEHDLEGYLAQCKISLNTLSWHQHVQDFIA